MKDDDIKYSSLSLTTNGNDQDTTIKKMLIAIDESGYRGKVIGYGLKLAKSLGADVTVTHVIDKSSVTALFPRFTNFFPNRST
jgi:nucleotide-binding universal stress UspA family protein